MITEWEEDWDFCTWRCPQCGENEGIHVQVQHWVSVTTQGLWDDGHYYDYQPDNNANCDKCGFIGRVKDFEPRD